MSNPVPQFLRPNKPKSVNLSMQDRRSSIVVFFDNTRLPTTGLPEGPGFDFHLFNSLPPGYPEGGGDNFLME